VNHRARLNGLLRGGLLLLISVAAPALRAQAPPDSKEPPAVFSMEKDHEQIFSLDGLWCFHPGDDPRWADPDFDDSQWLNPPPRELHALDEK
jgi:hypothetical protein